MKTVHTVITLTLTGEVAVLYYPFNARIIKYDYIDIIFH